MLRALAILLIALQAHPAPAESQARCDGRDLITALPAPERVHRGGAAIHVAATTEAERDVVAVWEQILGIEPIGVDDDFFARLHWLLFELVDGHVVMVAPLGTPAIAVVLTAHALDSLGEAGAVVG